MVDRIIHLHTQMSLHYTTSLVTVDTNTLDDVQTKTSDCQPIAQSAHSRFRSLLGCIAEWASPTGCEPKAQELFEDFHVAQFCIGTGWLLDKLRIILFWFTDRSCRADNYRHWTLWSSNEKSVATTRAWTQMCSLKEGWSSTENQTVRNLRRFFFRHSWTDATATGIIKEISVLKHHLLHLSLYAFERWVPSDGIWRFGRKRRVPQSPNGQFAIQAEDKMEFQIIFYSQEAGDELRRREDWHSRLVNYIWSIHLSIQLMKRLSMKDPDGKIKNHICCRKYWEEIFHSNKEWFIYRSSFTKLPNNVKKKQSLHRKKRQSN